jgi:hypothetical protein
MQKQEIAKIINKYRNFAHSSDDEEKSHHYEQFADYVEDNFDLFEENDFYETEEDLFDSFQQAESEIDAQWDSMFPEGDDDDSITDYLKS